MGHRGKWAFACAAVGLVLVLGGGTPASGQGPEDQIVGVVISHGPLPEFVLAESLDPPGMVAEAVVIPRPEEPNPIGDYAFTGLVPGIWRFAMPGQYFFEYYLDGIFHSAVETTPFTSPIEVPPPGAPRTLDLPLVRPGAEGGSSIASLRSSASQTPDTVSGYVGRAVGRKSHWAPSQVWGCANLYGCGFDIPGPFEYVAGVPVVIEVLETNEIHHLTTGADGSYVFGLPDLGGDRTVHVTVEGAMHTNCGWDTPLPGTSLTVQILVEPGTRGHATFVIPGREVPVSGRAFFDDAPKNGAYDPGEAPAAGIEVVLREMEEGRTHTATTAADGSYTFPAVWGPSCLVSAPAFGYRRFVALHGIDDDLPPVQSSGDLPLDRPPCCVTGDLHAFRVATAVWVGERDQACYEVGARLRELRGGKRGLIDQACSWFLAKDGFEDPAVGFNDVLSIVGVQVVDGWAIVVLKVVASENLFPAGFFGDVERRLEVFVGGRRRARGVAAFTCDALRPGAWFTAPAGAALPPCGATAAADLVHLLDPPADHPQARFLVLDTVPFEAWRTANPPGPCLEESASGEADFQWVELRIDTWAKPRKTNAFYARILHGGSFRDRLRVRFTGDLWEGEAIGAKGRLVVTRIERQAGNGWHAHVRVQAPNRADGNPGSLPAWWVGVETRLNGVRRSPWLDLSAPLEKGQVFGWCGDLLYEVLRWRTTRDAAACY